MPKPAARFDVESVRASWDDAADVYAEGQTSGRDYYRYEFFGPAQLALCGDVREMRVLDVGCGNGYFARELARCGARVIGIDVSPRMKNTSDMYRKLIELNGGKLNRNRGRGPTTRCSRRHPASARLG